MEDSLHFFVEQTVLSQIRIIGSAASPVCAIKGYKMRVRVKKQFEWHQNYSAIKPIIVPAGVTAHFSKKCDCYFVDPHNFPEGSIERHDATYYGCRVDWDNVWI